MGEEWPKSSEQVLNDLLVEFLRIVTRYFVFEQVHLCEMCLNMKNIRAEVQVAPADIPCYKVNNALEKIYRAVERLTKPISPSILEGMLNGLRSILNSDTGAINCGSKPVLQELLNLIDRMEVSVSQLKSQT